MRKLLLLAGLLALASPADAYRAGDVVTFHVTVPALNGVATDPQSLKAYVYNGTACIDSSKTLAAGIAALPLAGGKSSRVYAWTWTVPTSYASTSAWLRVVCRAVTSEIPQDWVFPQPTRVPVNAATVDTLLATVTDDLVSQHAASTETAIEPGDYGATAVTQGGHDVPWATVQLCRESNGTNIVATAISDADGAYILRAPLRPAAADTFYIWARLGLRAVKSGERVIVP